MREVRRFAVFAFYTIQVKSREMGSPTKEAGTPYVHTKRAL